LPPPFGFGLGSSGPLGRIAYVGSQPLPCLRRRLCLCFLSTQRARLCLTFAIALTLRRPKSGAS
jgi:hypothetical protein